MSTQPVSKYVLKPLEEEIGLFDRKLAHLLKYETFPTEEDRQAAANKLSAKRERLVRTVRELTEPSLDSALSSLPPAKKAPAKRKATKKLQAAKSE